MNPRRTRLVLVLLVLVSITLVTVDLRSSSSSSGVRAGASAIIGPVQRAVGTVVRPLVNGVRTIGDLGNSRDELARLRTQNEALQAEIDSNRLDSAAAQELRDLQLLAGAGQYRTLPARVVGLGGTLGFEWTITLDVGSRDKVTVDQTVISARGLVGRIVQVGPFTSQVLLAIDPTSGVGTRLEGSDSTGTVDGQGLNPLELRLLNASATVRKGDRLVTGPLGESTFAPGVPIGIVSEVLDTPGALTRSAKVTPFVDYTSLDLVGVVLEAPRVDPRDSVLPPMPAPSPTPAPAGVPAATDPSATPAPLPSPS